MHQTDRHRSLFVIIISLCFFCGIAAPCQAGDTYELKLGRQIREFDNYLVKASSTSITDVVATSAIGHRTAQRSDTTVVMLDAMCDVKQVTEDGQEAVKSITVRNMTFTSQGQTHDLMPTGAVLQATFSEAGTELTQDNAQIAETMMPLLLTVIRSEGGGRTADIMDAGRPVTVGDEWPADSSALLQALDPTGSVTPVALKGTVKFIGIDTTRKPAAIVRLTAKAVNALGEIDGRRPLRSEITMDITLTAPLDVRYPIAATQSVTKIKASFEDNGTTIDMTHVVRDSFTFLR
jgi:hypothetical protein